MWSTLLSWSASYIILEIDWFKINETLHTWGAKIIDLNCYLTLSDHYKMVTNYLVLYKSVKYESA